MRYCVNLLHVYIPHDVLINFFEGFVLFLFAGEASVSKFIFYDLNEVVVGFPKVHKLNLPCL